MKKSKILLSTLLAIVLCVSLIVGASLAMFISEGKTDISVTSGRVDVVATAEITEAWTADGNADSGYTRKYDATPIDDGYRFADEGTALFTSDKLTGTKLTVSDLTPGDGLLLRIAVTNNSNIKVKYRVEITNPELDDALFNALTFTYELNDSNVQHPFNGRNPLFSNWMYFDNLGAESNKQSTVDVEIELPVTAADEYQGQSSSFVVTVFAAQINAHIDDPVAPSTTASTTISEYADVNNWDADSKYTTIYLDDVVTLSTNTDQGLNGTYNKGEKSWDLYQDVGATLTISALWGYELVSFTITYSTGDSSGVFKAESSAILADGAETYLLARSVADYDIESQQTYFVSDLNKTSITLVVASSDDGAGKVLVTDVQVVYRSVQIWVDCDHEWGDWETTTEPTCTENGEAVRTCAICRETETQVISAKGHAWSETWSTDGESHWRDCDNGCGKKDGLELHQWNTWTETKKATCTATGEEKSECDVCSQETTRETEALGHKLTEVKGQDATCTEAGWLQVWSCSECKLYFADQDCAITIGDETAYQLWKTEGVGKLSATGHSWDTTNIAWNWTGYTAATATVTCKNDGEHKLSATVKMTVDSDTATCTEVGHIRHTATATFEGITGTFTEYKDQPTEALGHKLMQEDGWKFVDSDCVTSGHQAYWQCETCQKYFSTNDADPVEITVAIGDWLAEGGDGYIAPNGHDYTDVTPTWSWNSDFTEATATFGCTKCNHKEDVKATDITEETISAATCVDDRKFNYVATVSFNNGNYTGMSDEQTQANSALGHSYTLGNNEYVWSTGDIVTATLYLVCEVEGCEQKLTLTLSGDDLDFDQYNATCTNDGYTIWSVSVKVADLANRLKGKDHFAEGFVLPDNTTKVDGEKATGHDWSVAWNWTVDGATATAKVTLTCGYDSRHTETTNATITTVHTEATCEEDGYYTHSGSVKFDLNGETYTDSKVGKGEVATGHDWKNATADWTFDYNQKTATATITCGRINCQHSVTVIDDHLGENTQTPADCVNDRTFYYTATVEYEGVTFSTEDNQLQTEVDSRLGHNYVGNFVHDDTNPGKHYQWCERAEECKTHSEAVDCEYGPWGEVDGQHVRECTKCGHTEEHNPEIGGDIVDNGDLTHTGKCETCELPITEDCNIENYKCTKCGHIVTRQITSDVIDAGIWPGVPYDFSLIKDNKDYVTSWLDSQFNELVEGYNLTVDNAADYLEIIIDVYSKSESEQQRYFSVVVPFQHRAYSFNALTKAWVREYFVNGNEDGKTLEFTIQFTIALKEELDGKHNALYDYFTPSEKATAAAASNDGHDCQTYTFDISDITVPTDIQFCYTENDFIGLLRTSDGSGSIFLNGGIDYVELKWEKGDQSCIAYMFAEKVGNETKLIIYSNVDKTGESIECSGDIQDAYIGLGTFDDWVSRNYKIEGQFDNKQWNFSTRAHSDGTYYLYDTGKYSDTTNWCVEKGHSFGDWTCIDESSHSHMCIYCGEVETATHTYGDDWSDVEGKHRQTCICGKDVEHDPVVSNWTTIDAYTHKGNCDTCGLEVIANHNYGEGTDRHPCTECGDWCYPDGLQQVTIDFTTEQEGLESGKGTNITDGKDSDPVTLTFGENGEITIIFNQGKASTATRWWNSKGNFDLRTYGGSSFTISVGEGVITKIVIEFGKSDLFADGLVISGSTGVWQGELTSVTFTATGINYIKSITVYYAGQPAGKHYFEEIGKTPENCRHGAITEYQCTHCGVKTREEKGEPARDAHVLVKVDQVDATCTEPGNIEYYICVYCGETFEDGQSSVENVEIEARGHSYAQDADTTYQSGSNVHYTPCSTCGDLIEHETVFTDNDKIEGHDLSCKECYWTGEGAHDTSGDDGACSKCGYLLVFPELSYVKVTDNLDDFSGIYLIVWEKSDTEAEVLDGSLGKGMDTGHNVFGATITDGIIKATEELYAISFKIEKIAGTDAYTILSFTTGYYIGHTSGNTLGTNDTITEAYINTISITGDGTAISVGDYSLRFNSASGDNNYRFRYYSNGQQAIQLYKLVGDPTGGEEQPTRVSVTVKNDEQYGKLVVSGDQINYIEGDHEVGTIISFTIETENGWIVDTVTVDGIELQADEYGVYSFELTAAVTITVTYKQDTTSGDSEDDEEIWDLVTDVSVLSENSVIIIVGVKSDVYYALSTTQQSNNRKYSDPVTLNTDGTITINDTVQRIVIQNGKKDGTFAFYVSGGTGTNAVNGGYLYAAGSGSNNYLRTETELSDNSSWEISIIEATGVATIKAQGSNTNNWLRNNTSSSLFSCYGATNSQADIKIYILRGTEAKECDHDGTMVHVDEQPATCTQSGLAAHWMCTSCGKTFVDEQGTEGQPKVLEALGHTYSDSSVYTDLQNGNHTAKCDVCEETQTHATQFTHDSDKHYMTCEEEGCQYDAEAGHDFDKGNETDTCYCGLKDPNSTDPDPIEPEVVKWKLVESTDELTNDAIIIIASGTNALGSQNSGSYRDRVTIDIVNNNDGTVSIDYEKVVYFTLEYESVSDTFALKGSDGYYLSYTGSDNKVYTSTSKDDNSVLWRITRYQSTTTFNIESANVAGRYLRYNSNSPRFACYTTVQNVPSIYKLTSGTIGESTTPDEGGGNQGGGTKSWTLATSIDIGDEIILTYLTNAMGAISTTSTKYGLQVASAITINTDMTATINKDTEIGKIKVEAGKTTGTFALKLIVNDQEIGYLSWDSGNSLTIETSVTASSSWNITIGSNGVADITNANTSGTSTRYLRYNNNNGSYRFACYTSGQQSVTVYKHC